MADHSGSSMDMPEAARAWLDHSGSSMDMPEAARAWLDHSGSSRICQRPRAWLDLPRSVIQAASSHAEPGWTVRVHHRETKVVDALPCRWTQAATSITRLGEGTAVGAQSATMEIDTQTRRRDVSVRQQTTETQREPPACKLMDAKCQRASKHPPTSRLEHRSTTRTRQPPVARESHRGRGPTQTTTALTTQGSLGEQCSPRDPGIVNQNSTAQAHHARTRSQLPTPG